MIATETVTEIKSLLQQQGVDEGSVGELRSKWPDIHFTYCSEDDVHSGKPVDECEQFSIYLVDGREHCLCLTNDHEVATGLVIAERYEDDE